MRAELRKPTEDASGHVAEAVARRIRRRLLGNDLRRHQLKHGVFTDEQRAGARVRIFGSDGAGSCTEAD